MIAFVSCQFVSSSVVRMLAEYIHTRSPKAKGWSYRTIYKMVQFYETYSTQGFKEIVHHYGMQHYLSKSDQRNGIGTGNWHQKLAQGILREFFYLSGNQYTKKKDSFMLLKGLTLRNDGEKKSTKRLVVSTEF